MIDPLTRLVNAQEAARKGIASDAPVEILSLHLAALRTAVDEAWPLVDPLNAAGVDLGPLMVETQRLCQGLAEIEALYA